MFQLNDQLDQMYIYYYTKSVIRFSLAPFKGNLLEIEIKCYLKRKELIIQFLDICGLQCGYTCLQYLMDYNSPIV